GAGVVTALLVIQLFLEQVDRGFVHGDLLRGQQHVVVRQADGEQRVGNSGLILGQGLLFGGAGRLQRRDHSSALVNGLDNLDACVPVLVWLRKTTAIVAGWKTF